jgi:hypothetical protein
MVAKKPYPRNVVLRTATADIERQAVMFEAERRGNKTTPSDVSHELMRKGGLLELVAFYFPEDAPKLANSYAENGETS